MIIIPDLHCEEYWRGTVDKLRDNEKIIFLGDYFDNHENIMCYSHTSRNMANVNDILSLKEKLGDRCILLIGNHELSYLDSLWHAKDFAFPHDIMHHFKIRKLLLNHIEKFNILHVEQHNDTFYMFSHAGVNPNWFGRLPKKKQMMLLSSKLSRKSFKRLAGCLRNEVSCLWEYFNPDKPEKKFIDGNIFQIFGHAYFHEPKILSNVAALDTGKPYRLNLTTGEIVTI